MAAKIRILSSSGELLRRTTRARALRKVESGTHDWLNDQAIVEVVAEASHSDPRRFFRSSHFVLDELDGGPILPPRAPENLLLYYPHRDQSSYQSAS
ncbi:MAG TPA: hypothetical protein VMQ17_08970 [Candidatus Sulfotelmatobacter sp.]|nr:hypothetical protein [Candidatus Sulfotelmatobacter sp.]